MPAVVQINQAEILRKLREQLAADRPAAARRAVKTGWPATDETLPRGGLACGAVHEWLGVSAGNDHNASARDTDLHNAPQNASPRRTWTPPLGLMIHLARRMATDAADALRSAPSARRIAWIGPKIWPYPIALCGGASPLLSASLFIRVERADDRLFAALLVLRSRGAGVVVIDGSGLDLTATRRLQHAAEAGGALCLLARPPWEQDCLSAAQTRWRVRAAPSWNRNRQRWIVELLRCKGLPPARSEAGRLWMLERDHATGDVVMAAELGHGCRAPTAAAGGIRTG
jgi:protein ImuA